MTGMHLLAQILLAHPGRPFHWLSIFLIPLFFTIGRPAVSGQAYGSYYLHQQRYHNDTDYQARFDQLEAQIYQMFTRNDFPGDQRAVLSIPVVVHVMHLPDESVPGQGASNPTDDQIRNALDLVNDAFRHRGAFADGPFYSNAGIPGADVNIEFCLANIDPNGVTTTGITRTPTELSNLFRDDPCSQAPTATQDDCLKGLDYWNSFDYLNIWLVNSICAESPDKGCQLTGYAYPAGAHGQAFDGIVLQASSWVNDPNIIPNAVTEFGHYLNLFDTYTDPDGGAGPKTGCDNNSCLTEGDKICDTPPDAGPDPVDCIDAKSANTCSTDADDPSPYNPFTKDVEDLYENFMDGGNSFCRNSFTPDQAKRMRAALQNTRGSLLQSPGCAQVIGLNATVVDWENLDEIICSPGYVPKLLLANTGTEVIQNFSLNRIDNNGLPQAMSWIGTLIPGDTVSFALPPINQPSGMHSMEVWINRVNGSTGDDVPEDDSLKTDFFMMGPTPVIIDQFPDCQGFESGNLSTGWQAVDKDGKVGFDLWDGLNCGSSNNYALRYNSSGMWNTGVGAKSTGTRDILISPVVDLTTVTSASFLFDLAHKVGLPNKQLTLEISAATDCDSRFKVLYRKSHFDLETSTSNYDPSIVGWEPACDEWRTEEVSLDEFAGQMVYLKIAVELADSYSQNLYLDNFCLQTQVGCDLPQAIPVKPGLYWATDACTDTEGWTHFIKAAASAPATSEDVLLLSIKNLSESGTRLNPEDVVVAVTPRYGNGGHDLSNVAGYARNLLGWHTMGRFFFLQPDQQPGEEVTIRFYFDRTDLEDMRKAVAPRPLADERKLAFFLTHPSQNPDPGDGHRSIRQADLREYLYDPQVSFLTWDRYQNGDIFGAEMTTDLLGGGGGGTGGDGDGWGAFYPDALIPNGKQDLSQLTMEWSTNLEVQTDRFEVWYSRDGENFGIIDSISAAGNSIDREEYVFQDSLPEKGYHYYFVTLRHQNGITLRTDTLQLRFDPGLMIKSFPNPSAGPVSFEFEAFAGDRVELGIYTGTWNQVFADSWFHDPQQPHASDITGLAPGIYFYVLRTGEMEYRGTLIKQ